MLVENVENLWKEVKIVSINNASHDGYEKGVMAINRQIPGTPIHVCKNDIIVVDVTSKMEGTSTTIHWHRLHIKQTPYADGFHFLLNDRYLLQIRFVTRFKRQNQALIFVRAIPGFTE